MSQYRSVPITIWLRKRRCQSGSGNFAEVNLHTPCSIDNWRTRGKSVPFARSSPAMSKCTSSKTLSVDYVNLGRLGVRSNLKLLQTWHIRQYKLQPPPEFISGPLSSWAHPTVDQVQQVCPLAMKSRWSQSRLVFEVQ